MSNYDALFAFACLVGVVAIFYGPWQGLCVEYSRQIIFEQREKLFDLAASGSLSFNSDEYRQIREFLNKAIRFSHEMTIWRYAVNKAALNHYKVQSEMSLKTIVEAIPDERTRSELDEIVDRSLFAVVLTMGARSLPLLIAGIVMFAARKAGVRRTGLGLKLRKFEQSVQHDLELSPS